MVTGVGERPGRIAQGVVRALQLSYAWRRRCPVRTPPALYDPPVTVCEGCGRPLRAGWRRVCARCLGVAA